MPLPRNVERTPEQIAAGVKFMAQQREAKIQTAAASARKWIACGGAAEVRSAWLTARDNEDAELQAIYAQVLTEAGEKNPLSVTGEWR